jgi:hypothetical protein
VSFVGQVTPEFQVVQFWTEETFWLGELNGHRLFGVSNFQSRLTNKAAESQDLSVGGGLVSV